MRSSKIKRDTLETQVNVSLDLDGAGSAKLATGLPFLDHMLDQVARHGMIDLEIAAKGDLHIDAHHTVEDVGISLGQAWPKRSVTSAAYAAMATPMCRWTRRSPGW